MAKQHRAAPGVAAPGDSVNDIQEIGSGERDSKSLAQGSRWLQVVVARGGALRRLLTATSLTVSEPNNTVVLRGIGGYFPEMEGLEWAAGCGAIPDEFTGAPLSDIRCVLDFLIGESLLLFSDAPCQEVEAWLRVSGR